MTRCFVGIGSNLGDSQAIFQQVFKDLSDNESIELRQVSSNYRSKPLQDANQPDYLNAVICLDTNLSPLELLDVLQALETKYGRVRNAVRWDSRTLDLDILLFGDQEISSKRLTVPHKEIPNRDFVLIPLYEIAPELSIPGKGALKTLLVQCENRGMKKL